MLVYQRVLFSYKWAVVFGCGTFVANDYHDKPVYRLWYKWYLWSLVFGCSQSNIMIIQISAIAKAIYIYTYIYICIYIYICVWVYIYIWVYIYMGIYIYIYGYIYIWVYIWVYIHIWVYIYIYVWVYIYGYIFRTWPYIIQVCSKYTHVLSVNIPILDWQSAVYVLYPKNPHQDIWIPIWSKHQGIIRPQTVQPKTCEENHSTGQMLL